MTIIFRPSPKPAKREKQARKPVKRRNRKRYSANWLRAYGSPERVAFVEKLACANCHLRASETSGWLTIANAHIENGGRSRKADAKRIIPLCESIYGNGCHQKQHQHGWSALEFLSTPDAREAWADHTERAWQAFLNSAVSPEREPSNG